MVFPANAPQYSFRLLKSLDITDGLTNHSAASPRFIVTGSSLRIVGTAQLDSTGTGRSAVIETHDEGKTVFTGLTGGGNAHATTHPGGSTIFEAGASAEEMTIVNLPGIPRSRTEFLEGSTAGKAHLTNHEDAALVFGSGSLSLSAGKIENHGIMSLRISILTVANSFTQTSTGQLTFIREAHIAVTNRARLDGDLIIVGVGGGGEIDLGRHVLIHAEGGRRGRFANVSFQRFDPATTQRIAYEGGSVVLFVEPR